MPIDCDAPILIEVSTKGAVRKVSNFQEKTVDAIDSAMSTIYSTATHINKTIEALEVKPSNVEVNFGVKVTAESGAIIAKAGGEANFSIKITWKCQE
jgi:hypothetical protein